MKKLAYYIQIVTWLDEMEEKDRLFASQMTYGNIACFVEGYAEKSEFTEYMKLIKELAHHNDINELCWNMNIWISRLIEDSIGADHLHEKDRREYLEFQMDLQKEDYQEHQCDDFWLAGDDMFPDWFWEYYAVRITERD